MLYAKINVKSNHFLFLTSLESPLNKGGSEGVWKYRWLHTFERSHDRWLIIDDIVYHFGASLKDLGKRWFSVDIVTEHTADDFISRL